MNNENYNLLKETNSAIKLRQSASESNTIPINREEHKGLFGWCMIINLLVSEIIVQKTAYIPPRALEALNIMLTPNKETAHRRMQLHRFNKTAE